MDNLPEPRIIRITPMSFLLGAGVVLLVLFIGIIATRIVSVLVLLFLGILLAESIRPIANKLQTWKIPRGVAVMIVYLLLALVLTGVGLIIVPPLVVQVRGFDESDGATLIDWVRAGSYRVSTRHTVDLGFEDGQLRRPWHKSDFTTSHTAYRHLGCRCRSRCSVSSVRIGLRARNRLLLDERHR